MGKQITLSRPNPEMMEWINDHSDHILLFKTVMIDEIQDPSLTVLPKRKYILEFYKDSDKEALLFQLKYAEFIK